MERLLVYTISGALVTAFVLYAISYHDVAANCQRTNETRPGPTTYVMSGKVLVPISSTQRRYICENGDIWL